MSKFQGNNQAAGGFVRAGAVSQRQLVPMLRALIDTAKGKAANRSRDEARRSLHNLLLQADWQTPYVLHNIGARRCRYLSGIGYPVPAKYTLASSIPRLQQWSERNG